MNKKRFISMIILSLLLINCTNKIKKVNNIFSDNITKHNTDSFYVNRECDFPLKFKNKYDMEFVYIPSGSFMMGNPDNSNYGEHNEFLH
jgi:formylglycine-generating enzyme required for sulfatase activity